MTDLPSQFSCNITEIFNVNNCYLLPVITYRSYTIFTHIIIPFYHNIYHSDIMLIIVWLVFVQTV